VPFQRDAARGRICTFLKKEGGDLLGKIAFPKQEGTGAGKGGRATFFSFHRGEEGGRGEVNLLQKEEKEIKRGFVPAGGENPALGRVSNTHAVAASFRDREGERRSTIGGGGKRKKFSTDEETDLLTRLKLRVSSIKATSREEEGNPYDF